MAGSVSEGFVMLVYLYLSLAIVCEVAATLMLKASDGWTKWSFGIGSIILYAIAGAIFALVLKGMSVGMAYAIWSGLGVGLVCVASVVIWNQQFDGYALAGIILIVLGTLLITTKSQTVLQ